MLLVQNYSQDDLDVAALSRTSTHESLVTLEGLFQDSTSEPSACVETVFRVACPLNENEALIVLGDCDALGAWNSSEAPRMLAVAGNFGRWELRILLPSEPIFYRYAIVNKEHGTVKRWESYLGGRFLWPGLTNQAQDCTARLSGPSGCADHAVNGWIYNCIPDHSAATTVQDQPWWELQLRGPVYPSRVVVWHQSTSTQESRRFSLLASRTPFPAECTFEDAKAGADIAHGFYVEDMSTATYTEITALELSGQNCDIPALLYFRLYAVEDSVSLGIREFQVFTEDFQAIQILPAWDASLLSKVALLKKNSKFVHLIQDGTLGGATEVSIDARDKSTASASQDWICHSSQGELMIVFDSWEGEETVNLLDDTNASLCDFEIMTKICFLNKGGLSELPAYQSAKEAQETNLEKTATFVSCRVPVGVDWKKVVVMVEVHSDNKLIGSCQFFPAQQPLGPYFKLTIPITSKLGFPLGYLQSRLVWIDAFQHEENTLENVWTTHWSTMDTLFLGHRGLGASYGTSKVGVRRALVQENTVNSFLVAEKMHADGVEFDVLLTKDRVPIIYHDFGMLCEGKDGKAVRVNEASKHPTLNQEAASLLKMNYHDISWNQVCQLNKMHSTPVSKLATLMHKHWSHIMALAGNTKAKPYPGLKRHWISNPVPTLKETLERVPKHMKFDIEIKYPDQTSELLESSAYDMNDYLNTILDTVFDCAGSRPIVFTSFNPDICVMLRRKQARYPVMMLVDMPTDLLGHHDRRSRSLRQAIQCASTHGLNGLVIPSNFVLESPSLVEEFRQRELILWTWGVTNSFADNLKVQVDLGVGAVICDNIGDMVAQTHQL